jgi:cell division protein FtsW (lipid II flippase)
VKHWLFPLSDPFEMGFPATLSLEAISAAGLPGLGRDALTTAHLFMPHDFSANALTYLSLWLGNAVAALFAVLPLVLLGILFLSLPRLDEARRNVATGIWLFVAVNQVWSIGSPLGLTPWISGSGIAFIGSASMGCLLLLLGLFCLWSDSVLKTADRGTGAANGIK